MKKKKKKKSETPKPKTSTATVAGCLNDIVISKGANVSKIY